MPRRSAMRPGESTIATLVDRIAAPAAANERLDIRREAVAAFCKMLGERIGGGTQLGSAKAKNGVGNPAAKLSAPPHTNGSLTTLGSALPERPLSPRMRQTLERLLAGDSEKQIAARLSLSRHTVHVYVKALHKTFEVSSRGELLSRFVTAQR